MISVQASDNFLTFSGSGSDGRNISFVLPIRSVLGVSTENKSWEGYDYELILLVEGNYSKSFPFDSFHECKKIQEYPERIPVCTADTIKFLTEDRLKAFVNAFEPKQHWLSNLFNLLSNK